MQILRDADTFHTVVVGGGIGGLALAAGLRRVGLAVTVLDRDVDLAATGGYHLTLRSDVLRALAELLPADCYERLLASAADGRRRDPDILWDDQGRILGPLPLPTDDVGVDVDRVTLRLLLAEAVGDDLRTGRTCTGLGTDPLTVRFADGTEEPAAVVVGADGVHSVVARALAGGPTSAPTGLVGISGRTPVEALDVAERDRLGTRSSTGVGSGGTALYAGYFDPVGHAVLDRPDLRAATTGTRPSYIWGAMLPESPDTRGWARLSGADLRDATTRALQAAGWAADALQLVTRTDPASVGLFRFHAASREAADQAPWRPGPVTALGDAVHATPPTAGMGAGAAILDAHRLRAALVDVAAGRASLTDAVGAYEAKLRERGAAVVRAAMVTVDRILATR